MKLSGEDLWKRKVQLPGKDNTKNSTTGLIYKHHCSCYYDGNKEKRTRMSRKGKDMNTVNRFNWYYSEQNIAAQLKEQELGLALVYTFTGKKRGHCVSESACGTKL